jgi:hypothetical protein
VGRWDGSERQRERCEEQAALETGTETETVIDCNRNCKGQRENIYLVGGGTRSLERGSGEWQ